MVRSVISAVVFCLDFDPFYFLFLCDLLFKLWSFYFLFLCGLFFGLWSFYFLLLFPCQVFFLLFIYLSLNWFPQIIHAESLQTVCPSCQLAKNVFATFELLSFKGAFQCWSNFSPGAWISQRIYTNGAMCLDAHAICSYFVQNLIQILNLVLCCWIVG
jgi:uncharacterized membrane protein